MARLRTPILCLAWLALVAGLALGVDRVLAGRTFAHPAVYVPAYRAFGDYTTGAKLWTFRHSATPDVMFLGNSRTLFDVDPLMVDRELARGGAGVRSFNLAFPSVDLNFWQRFFARYYDRPMPRVVVLGLAPRDVDAAYTFDDVERAFFDSRGYQNRDLSPIVDRAENVLARSFVMWGRHNETRAIPPADLLHGKRWDPDVIEVANDRGWGRFPGVHRFPVARLLREHDELARRHGRDRLRFTAGQRAALDDIRARICRAGGRLVVATLPVYYDAESYGTVEYRGDLRRALQRYSQEAGVPFVDTATATEPRLNSVELWGDGDHLNAAGARRFAPMYADLLAPVLEGAGRPGC